MSSDLLIEAQGLGKFYPSRVSYKQLLRYLAPWPQQQTKADFWALRDFDFTLRRGEVVGLIGRNGCGKSTFLQLVAGLLEPSAGHITVRGKTAALLELGAGFNPEFSGRENILLSGRVYGLTTADMADLIDPIIAFADIGDHLDQPVKTYSSGMFARLAFAVAIQVNPQILLVDEILSVGDLGFQAKCYRRIEQIKQSGASILFVSHDLNTMQMLCDRLILLEDGRKLAEGTPKEMAQAYTERLSARAMPVKNSRAAAPGYQNKGVTLLNIRLTDTHGNPAEHPVTGKTYHVHLEAEFLRAVTAPVVTMQIKTMVGLVVADISNIMLNQPLPDMKEGKHIHVCFEWTCNMCPGPYRIGVGIAETTHDVPVPLAGREALVVEVSADRPSYGIVDLTPKLMITQTDN
jgi:ABC-type polysaccharide/polyol phosphate transport system ATPase subunit